MRWQVGDELDVAGGLEDDADGAEVARGGFGDEPVADFFLHREAEPRKIKFVKKQINQQRGGDVVGQVGDERAATGGCCGFGLQGGSDVGVDGVFVGEDVGVEQREVVRIGEAVGDDVVEGRVDFDGNDVFGQRDKVFGEGTGAGSDLEDDVVGGDVGRLDQATHQVAVDEEILPVATVGTVSRVGEEGLDFRGCLNVSGHEASLSGVDCICRSAVPSVWKPGRDSIE